MFPAKNGLCCAWKTLCDKVHVPGVYEYHHKTKGNSKSNDLYTCHASPIFKSTLLLVTYSNWNIGDRSKIGHFCGADP